MPIFIIMFICCILEVLSSPTPSQVAQLPLERTRWTLGLMVRVPWELFYWDTTALINTSDKQKEIITTPKYQLRNSPNQRRTWTIIL